MEEKCKCCNCKDNICPVCGGKLPDSKNQTKESNDNANKMNLNDVYIPENKNFNLND